MSTFLTIRVRKHADGRMEERDHSVAGFAWKPITPQVAEAVEKKQFAAWREGPVGWMPLEMGVLHALVQLKD